MKRDRRSQRGEIGPRDAGAGETSRVRLLLAEDDDELRALLASVLRREGYEVIEVADGNQLVRCFSAAILHPARFQMPDVVVSDVRMPGPSGLDVLRGLRECAWTSPVILITAFGDEATHREAERLGAAAVLDKPFDVDALCATVVATVPPVRSEAIPQVSA